MGKTSTIQELQQVTKQFNADCSRQIKFLQDYCRAFTCVKTKQNKTITIWLN